jgi:predicted enzyme related to lactoylglutathione lyase
MADQNVRGRFIWHELETPESERAHEFYSEVLGWKKQAFEQDPSYSMFAATTGPLGGSVALRYDRPGWLPYIGTDDIERTVDEAERLGASLLQDVTPIPNGSEYAILADPHGARFAVYASGGEPEPERAAPERGEFSWHELATEDFRASFDFYSRLFGWESISEHDMGPSGVYLIFGRDGRSLGGMFNKGDAGRQGDAYWLGYVRVADVNEAANAVKARGGTVDAGPMEVPGGDWIAQCVDPHGALFAVQATAEDMRSRGGMADRESGSASAPEESVEGIPSSIASSPNEAYSDDVPSNDAAFAQASPKRASSKKASSTKASSKKASAKKPSAKKASAKKASATKVDTNGSQTAAATQTSEQASGRKKAAKKAANKKTAKKAGAKKSAKKKASKKKTSKKKTVTKKTAKKAGAKKASKKKARTTKKAGAKKAPGKKASKKTSK